MTRQLLSARARRQRHPILGLCDQSISSASNFAVTLTVARSGSPLEFGRISIALTVYYMILLGARSLVAEPILLRHQGDRRELEARTSMTGGLLVGSVAGVATLAVVVAARPDGDLARALALLAVSFPLLLWFDVQRYQWFALNLHVRAIALDGLWLAMFLAGVVLGPGFGPVGIWMLWCAAGTAVGLVSMAWSVGPSSPGRAVDWMRRHADIGRPLLVENAAAGISFSLAVLMFSVISRDDQVGAVRGAVTMFGPLTVLNAGLYPTLIRRAQVSRPTMVRLVRVSGFGFVVFVVVWTIALLVIPTSLGVEILGESWALVRDIIPPMGLAVAFNACVLALLLGLRVLGALTTSMRIRLVMVGPSVIIPVVLGASAGARGFAFGLVGVAATTALLLLKQLRRCLDNDPAG